MERTNSPRRRALVTGASSGLGVDFAKQLAQRGYDLVLIARRADALESVAKQVVDAYAVDAVCIALDLSTPDAPSKLKAETDRRGLVVDVLINNAGYGVYGRFDEVDDEKEQAMIRLNVSTLVALTKLYAAEMKRRGWGRILQVASIGAFQPSPLYASYSATKSFVLNYSIAVNHELKSTGVSCTALSPGVTRTAFLEVADQTMSKFQKMTLMESADVVKSALDGLMRKKIHVVPGFANRMGEILARAMTRGASAGMAEAFVR